jgi:hypothetical protein
LIEYSFLAFGPTSCMQRMGMLRGWMGFGAEAFAAAAASVDGSGRFFPQPPSSVLVSDRATRGKTSRLKSVIGSPAV